MTTRLHKLGMFVFTSLCAQNGFAPPTLPERLAIETALSERLDALIAGARADSTWEDLQDPAIDAAIEIGSLVMNLEIATPTTKH